MSLTLEAGPAGSLRSSASTPCQDMLAAVRTLAPSLAARAPEMEAARRMPLDIVETLRELGVFRMYVPRSHGGLELDLAESLEILTELARAEGSVGWIAMIGSGSAPFFSRLPRQTFDQVYADGPDVIIAGSAAPMGRAEQVDGGYRVTGRWPFASGCQHADWIFSGCMVTQDGAPATGPEGGPIMRHIALPANVWTIEDTWRVAGLKGTGSCHISLQDLFVPDANMFNFEGPSCLPGPLYQAPLQLLPLMHCTPAVGIAEGAIDDLVALADTGRQQMGAREPMRDSPMFQAELGRIQAEVRAARAMMEAQIASHWRHALAGETGAYEPWIESQQSAVWVTGTCLRVVDACFALGGGGALYDDSPLQRRMRDLHAAAQHRAVQARHYLLAGAVRLGHPARHPMRG